MAFASRLREELARVLPRRRCCQQAELLALVSLDGRPADGRFVVQAANAAVARKLYTLGKQVWGGTPRVQKDPRSRRGRYLVELQPPDAAGGADTAGEPAAPGRVAEPAGPQGFGQVGGKPPAVPGRDCCRRAYVRAVILSRGSLADPETGYHLEVALDTDRQAEDLREVLAQYGVRTGLVRRKGKPVVYLKDADDIAEVLRLSGGHGSLLAFEDFRVLKEMRNQINRLVNAEAANVEKAVTAALRQLEDIRLIEDRIGLSGLPPSLAQVARLRLEHPDASLADLGQLVHPPISKSAVNHRMRRLAALAAQLRRNSPAHGGN
ncbi:MAG TPA: DNA-binding protein WhiA [Limnochordales bacterium]